MFWQGMISTLGKAALGGILTKIVCNPRLWGPYVKIGN